MKHLQKFEISIYVSGFPKAILSNIKFYDNFPDSEWENLKTFIKSCKLDDNREKLPINCILMVNSFDEYFKQKSLDFFCPKL